MLMLAFCSAGFAATIHVPADQPTIQAGINAAANGDTVLVAKGTYKESIDFQGKQITVISSDGPTSTIIQGDLVHPTVFFHNNETRQSVIEGFTITSGGFPGFGFNAGGGVAAVDSFPSVLNNIITDNQCHGVDSEFAGPLMQGNTIANTTQTADGYCGFNGSAIVLGGEAQSPPIIIGNVVANNKQGNGYDGGAILIWASDGVVIENNLFYGNATTGEGGAVALFNSDRLIFAQNLVYGNAAGYNAGGISLHPPDASQGDFWGLIQNNTFAGNTVSQPNQQGTNSASQVRLEANLAQYEFTDNVVVGNDNLPAFACGETYNYLSITPLVVDHNDIYNPKGPAYGGACPDQTGQYGNISADPLFVNAAGDDYHLKKGSPAIDSGNNSALQLLANAGFALATDLDGKARVQDATGKGYPVIDMGAYEFAGTGARTPTTIVLTPSLYYVDAGQSLTLVAQLYDPNGTPSGKVTFYEDGKQIGTGLIDDSGKAILAVGSSLVPGTHAFLAIYPGKGQFTACVSVKIYVLVKSYGVTLTITSNPNPSLVGQKVTFQIAISSAGGVPPGSVTVTDQSTGVTLATVTPDKSGAASFVTSSLAVGTHDIEAYYPGNGTYAPGYGYVTQVVQSGNATITTLTSLLNPSPAGAQVTFAATVAPSGVTGTPDGAVTFSDGANTLGTITLQGGFAAYSTSALSVGTHMITASYAGTANWTSSSATLTQTVNGIATTTTLAAAPNPVYATHPVAVTATVTGKSGGTPGGSVTLFDGNAQIAISAVNARGVATFNVTFATASSTPHTLTAQYGGNDQFNFSTSAAVEETVLFNPSATMIASITPNPVAAFHSTTLLATIDSSSTPNGNPGGTVTFATPAGTLGAAAVQNRTASLTVNAGAAGNYALTASYSGDPAYSPSVSAATNLTVVPEASSVTLTSDHNPAIVNTPVTFKAVVTPQSPGGALTGTVTFSDGSTPLGQSVAVSQGTASLITTTLAPGAHNITAAYSGDANVQPSTSAVLRQSIVLFTGDFDLGAKPDIGTTYTGEGAQFTITATPKNGFNLALNLSCEGLPQGAACTFSPAMLANGTGQTVLVVQTAAPQKQSTAVAVSASTAVLAGIFGFLLPRRRRLLWGAMVVLLAAMLPGCGAPAQIAGGTPPGAYTITVKAQTSASGPQLSHSINLKLTVHSLF